MEDKLGMVGCDREVFQRVWDRVGTGELSPVEVKPALAVPPPDRDGVRLQRCVHRCLEDASVYQALAARSSRQRGTLMSLRRRKIAQAKHFAAAYFLKSGVRYWPQVNVTLEADFYLTLRRQFLAEGQWAEELGGMGEGEMAA